jgi:S-layer protein (TIGR01567 family)
VSPGKPVIKSYSPTTTPVIDIIGALRVFSVAVNQTVNVTWLLNGGQIQTNPGVTTASYTNTSATQGIWDITAVASNENGTATQPWIWIVNAPGPPSITVFHPSQQVSDLVGALRTFNVTVNQTVDVIWLVNDVLAQTDTGVTTSSYTNTSAAQGIWNITVVAKNDNGSTTQKWDWIVTVPGSPSILFSVPQNPVNDIVGTPRTFSITVNQTVNVTWQVNGSLVQTNSNVNNANYTNISTVPGTFNITALFTSIYGTSSSNWTWYVKNPPENVTNLTITTQGPTYINWTWNVPADESFNGTQILIDGSLKDSLPKSLNYYNSTGFVPGTSHNISVIAIDTLGNRAIKPWPTNTGLTINTPIGNDVTPIGLPSGVTVTFTKIIGEGITMVSFAQNSPVIPSFMPLGPYVNITTTANFTGSVTITLNYTQPPAGFNASNVRLYSLNNSVWEDMTTNSDINRNIITGVVSGLTLIVAGIYPPPTITVIQDPSTEITVRDSIIFNISIDQAATINWSVNGNTSVGPLFIQAGGSSSLTFNSTTMGKYSIIVEAYNINGTRKKSWNVTVHPRTFFKGNRIWDGSKTDEFSLNYTWDSTSFSGFYYDVNEDVGDESITMTMNGYSDRTINSGNIRYTTSPQEVAFGYSGFGSYSVVGFMADKYFAGYTANTKPPEPTTGIDPLSALSQGHLHRVLIDDDTQRTISLGSTLALQDGYVVKATDIDLNARTMLISLLKDGTEVDSTPLSAGQTYVYTKNDLPLIMMRFESVFSGTEMQAAFLRGLFQISENYDTVSSGNDFGIMEITSINDQSIVMRNRASLSLSAGNTIDLMGDLKIIVADDADVRFALSVVRTGDFEVRSNVYRESDPIDIWTPYNFGMNIGKTVVGFYYDLDKGIGEETLQLAAPLDGSRIIPDEGLLYTTTPQEVNFGYTGFGSYDVIGFMADKYFAGYTINSRPPSPTTSIDPVSVITTGQLHKILIDDDTKRTFSLGGTLALKEGYVLKAKDIDLNARTILLSLLKDGAEVDVAPLSAGQTYVYTKNTGGGSNIPLILVRFDSVFSGTEIQAAFIKGLFQISENYDTITTGNRFGRMVVRSVGNDNIQMSNDGSISLSKGMNENLMGNIILKVGDTTDNSLRFYFAVEVTSEMIASQLIIDAPAQATAGDNIKISVTAGGNLIDGSTLEINYNDIGQTSVNGVLNYTLPRIMKGTYNITATKPGYDNAIKNIEILQYIEHKLSIDAPVMANQFESITIRVTSNNTNISNATVSYDNTTIGFTNFNGGLNYTLETSGIHALSASKIGYITVAREIDIRAPFSEYKAFDINITPNVIFTDEDATIKSNITNAGTKKDTLSVELIINGTAVDKRSVTLAPGEIKEINFTQREAKAGNYTVEILGQKGLLEVKQTPLIWNLILIVAIATGLGLIAVYLLTTKKRSALR